MHIQIYANILPVVCRVLILKLLKKKTRKKPKGIKNNLLKFRII